MKNGAKQAGIITLIVVLIVSAFWLGLGIGISSSPEPKYTYGEAESGTYWCEIYDDGKVTIHTQQRFLSNDEDGNLVVEWRSK